MSGPKRGAKHRVSWIMDCTVIIEAHGQKWSYAIETLVLAGVRDPRDLRCPECSTRLLGDANTINVAGVCLESMRDHDHARLSPASAN